MKKVILLITCSLDGFIAKEDGSVDWLVQDEEYDFEKFYDEIDTILMGYTTYTQILGFGEWPYKDLECYVFSRSHSHPDDERVIFSDKLVETTKDLIKQDGKDIWALGGASIISELVNNNLIDEFRIVIQPIVLGKGIPLFKYIIDEIDLDLDEVQKYKSGIVELKYKVKKK